MPKTSRTNSFFGIEKEDGTKWLRATHAELVANGQTDLSFRAWAAQYGVIVSSDGGWDDSRRRRLLSLDRLIDDAGDGKAPFDQTKISKIYGEDKKK
jgi:hypothetical protein